MSSPNQATQAKQAADRVERQLEALDVAIAERLERAAAQGETPSCRAGCSYCCHHAITVSRAEVLPLWRHVAERFTPEARAAAERRVGQWIDWLRREESSLGAAAMRPGVLEERILRGAPVCPFLVDHRCSVYAVRPVVCRAHHVTSPPERCLPEERGGPGGNPRG